MRMRRDIGLVRDEDDGVAPFMKAREEAHDFDTRLGIEISRRLVGQQDGGIVDEGPGDRDALPLTARELIWSMSHAVGEFDLLQRLGRALAPLLAADTGIDQRQFDVVQRRRAGRRLNVWKTKPISSFRILANSSSFIWLTCLPLRM